VRNSGNHPDLKKLSADGFLSLQENDSLLAPSSLFVFLLFLYFREVSADCQGIFFKLRNGFFLDKSALFSELQIWLTAGSHGSGSLPDFWISFPFRSEVRFFSDPGI
jgi:hypothetical protein